MPYRETKKYAFLELDISSELGRCDKVATARDCIPEELDETC